MSRFDFAFRAMAWSTVIIGAGYGCMTLLSPSREELLKVCVPPGIVSIGLDL
jgi:hypothetical protein